MSTTIRAKISKNNKYWISRHRYYELKHFCMQYWDWKKELDSLDGMPESEVIIVAQSKTNIISDPVSECVEKREELLRKIDLIEKCVLLTDLDLAAYILIGVTQGISYTGLRVNRNIPCCKNVYYDLYRKFFWILDQKRK